MKIRMLRAAGCALAAIGMANVALAQGGWPTIGIADIEPCRQQIAQFHQLEHAYFRSEMARYCTPGAQFYDAHNCGVFQQELSASQQKNDLAWYMEGNGSCQADYPCFGVAVINDPRSGEEEKRWVAIFEDNIAKQGTTIKPGTDFWEASGVVDNCTTAIWLKKYKAWRSGAPAPLPTPAQSQPVAARPVAASDPAFNTKLQTSQPNQLVQLAQELISTGQIDLAKLARNALMNRFPDDPLVPTIIDMLIKASATAPAPAAPTPVAPTPVATLAPASATPAPVASTPPASARLHITDTASLQAAFARVGYTLVATDSPTRLADAQNRFSAYALGCNGTRCTGIQLLAEYNMSPLPAHDRILQWNREKLFGRAFMQGNMVAFDMALMLPSNGMEPGVLKEQIDLYLDAASNFYNFVVGR